MGHARYEYCDKCFKDHSEIELKIPWAHVSPTSVVIYTAGDTPVHNNVNISAIFFHPPSRRYNRSSVFSARSESFSTRFCTKISREAWWRCWSRVECCLNPLTPHSTTDRPWRRWRRPGMSRCPCRPDDTHLHFLDKHCCKNAKFLFPHQLLISNLWQFQVFMQYLQRATE